MSDFNETDLLRPPRLGQIVVSTGGPTTPNATSKIPFRPSFLFSEDSPAYEDRWGLTFPYYDYSLSYDPFPQFTTTGGSSPTVICGDKVYLVETLVNSGTDTNADGTVDSWSGTRVSTLTIQFDASTNKIYLDRNVTESGNKPSGLTWQGPSEATSATQGSSSLSGTGTHGPYTREYTKTLSSEITPSVIDGWVSTWLAQSDTFKDATANNNDGSFRNTKVDGSTYRVRALEFFLNGDRSTGSREFPDFDSTEFEVQVAIRNRRNKMDVDYPNGTETYTLEDEVTDKAVDGYGVFDWDGDDTWSSTEAEDALSLISYKALSDTSNLTYRDFLPVGDISDAVFVTNTGSRYHVYLSFGYVEYDQAGIEPIGWQEVAADDFVIEGDGTAYTWLNELSHQSSIGTLDIDEIYEDRGVDGDPDWTLVFRGDLVTTGESDTEDYSGVTVISSRPEDNPMILVANRQRGVQRFGYSGLSDTSTRFRKYSYTNIRTTYVAGSAGSDVCGTTYPTGSFEEGWTQEYIDGAEQDRVQTHNLRDANSIDFTPEVAQFRGVDSLIYDSSSIVSNTSATETISGETINGGNFDFGLDVEDDKGEILSETHLTLSLDADYVTPKQTLQPPSAGETRFVEGQRLTYTPPP